jgi:hypothetical protein
VLDSRGAKALVDGNGVRSSGDSVSATTVACRDGVHSPDYRVTAAPLGGNRLTLVRGLCVEIQLD